MPAERPSKRQAAFLRQLALAMELPFIPVMGVLLGGGFGYLLDARLHTLPAFTLLVGLLGFAAGIREILRRVSKEEEDETKQDGGG